MPKRALLGGIFIGFWLGLQPLYAAEPSRAADAVASARPAATEAGMAMLAQGGNAFDAAVAVAAALAVVEPYGSGLGGGGFWLLRPAAGEAIMVDGRETAPLAAESTLYQDASGQVQRSLSLNGPLAAGIPGMPAALVHIAAAYGDLPLRRTLAPAIRLAREGFAVDEAYQRRARFRQAVLLQSPAAAAVFLDDGAVPAQGSSIRQPELAATLERLAAKGRDGFYEGPVAERLVTGVRAAGGIWQARDLRDYRIVERQPIRGAYHGMQVISAAPPSSGGVVLVEALNILSGYRLEQVGKATRIHLVTEAMRRAYRDRAAYLGDPDYIDMPLERLLHPQYAAGLRAGIAMDRATPSETLAAIPMPDNNQGRDTTHYSVLDAAGNAVAATLSINYPFGSGFMPPGTGVLLNDEMDDFVAKPGVPNAYGLIGNTANAIAPGKRMLSSMSPTIVSDAERLAILGTPGGSRIISMVLLASLAFAEGADVETLVSLPRYHHQFLPDRLQFEANALSTAIRQRLTDMGHQLDPMRRQYGDMQAIIWDQQAGEVTAASDPRGQGKADVVP